MDKNSYLEKLAAHADDRLRERTKAPPKVLHDLRKKLRKIKLERGTHHTRLSGYGVAVLKDTGKKHVVATVLTDNMRAPGKDMTMRLQRVSLEKIAARMEQDKLLGFLKPFSSALY